MSSNKDPAQPSQKYLGSGESVREKTRFFFFFSWGKELVTFLYLFYKYLSILKLFWSPVGNYIDKSSLRTEKTFTISLTYPLIFKLGKAKSTEVEIIYSRSQVGHSEFYVGLSNTKVCFLCTPPSQSYYRNNSDAGVWKTKQNVMFLARQADAAS